MDWEATGVTLLQEGGRPCLKGGRREREGEAFVRCLTRALFLTSVGISKLSDGAVWL